MSEPKGHEITGLLQAWREGDESALEKLTPKSIANCITRHAVHEPREREGHTLQTTALINEIVFTAFRSASGGLAESRPFLRPMCPADAAHTDRLARTIDRKSEAEALLRWRSRRLWRCSAASTRMTIAVDDALKALALVDERKSRVVELRFFGGLSVEETARF